MSSYLTQKGICHDLTPPYNPESNGVAERLNRSIGEGFRAMLLPITEKRLWAEAVQAFTYTKNCLYHTSVCGQTPYEAFHGKKPTIEHLQPFGQECYVHIPKAKRPSGSKLLPRAVKGLFVGYTKVPHHYQIFIPAANHVVVSTDVLFAPYVAKRIENIINVPTPNDNTSKKISDNHQVEINIVSQPTDKTCPPDEHITAPETAPQVQISNNPSNAQSRTRSNRLVRPRVFDDTITGEWWKSSRVHPSNSLLAPNNMVNDDKCERALISILEVPEPRTYKEAEHSPHWPEWKKAFEDEMSSFHENDVWQVVPRPEGRKIVSGKWVCKVKGNAQGELEKFKAKYVAKGYSQI